MAPERLLKRACQAELRYRVRRIGPKLRRRRHRRRVDEQLHFAIRVLLPDPLDDLPMRVVIPAYMISELKTAFQIGFAIFLPFLVIDMVTASVLLSMGMMQLPPIMISTPFKLLLFVMVDGWNLVIGSLVKSFF